MYIRTWQWQGLFAKNYDMKWNTDILFIVPFLLSLLPAETAMLTLSDPNEHIPVGMEKKCSGSGQPADDSIMFI